MRGYFIAKKYLSVLFITIIVCVVFSTIAIGQSQVADYSPQGSGNVVVVIQSADPDLIYFALLFADRASSNEWMDNVKIVFWGPAQKTLAELPEDS